VLTRTWGYDAAFQPTQTGIQPLSGLPTEGARAYNPASELQTLIEQQGGPPVRNYSYQFSQTGNRTQRTDNLGGPVIHVA
jgi:hypothetical protein